MPGLPAGLLETSRTWRYRIHLLLLQLGTGSVTGAFSFGARSLAGIGMTTELGYVNSIGKELMANGLFNIGEHVRWTTVREDG